MPSIHGGRLIVAPATTRIGSKGQLILEQTVQYRILSDSRTQEETEIALTTPNLPRAGVNGCRSVVVVREELAPMYCLATCEFSSEVQEGNDGLSNDPAGDPVGWIPQAEIEFEAYEDIARKDKDNKLYLNPAGDPYETGLVVHRRIACRVFTQFENVAPDAPTWTATTPYRRGQYVTKSPNIYQCTIAGTSGGSGPSGTGSAITDGGVTWRYITPPASGAVSLSQIEDRCDTTNETEFLGRAAGTLLLDVRKATIGSYNGYRVWRIDYVLKYKKDGWKFRQYNMGWRYKDGATKKFFEEEIGTAPDKIKVAYLGKLKSDGTKVDNELTDDPSISEFREYDKLEFKNFLRVV